MPKTKTIDEKINECNAIIEECRTKTLEAKATLKQLKVEKEQSDLSELMNSIKKTGKTTGEIIELIDGIFKDPDIIVVKDEPPVDENDETRIKEKDAFLKEVFPPKPEKAKPSSKKEKTTEKTGKKKVGRPKKNT